MKKKLFLMVVLFSALTLNVFSQAEIKKEEMMKKDAMMAKAVTSEDAAKAALNVGAKMPSFTLSDANGKSVNSDDLLKKGNLVVVFYRGAWCPFCNLYLKKLQENLSGIKAQGANIVAISVENPDKSLSVAQKNKVEFTVLSDPNLDTARKFGIVYQLDFATDEKYKTYGLDLVKMNGMAKPELPLSSTYIVNGKGEIVYAFHDVDYKKRAEPSVIIETLAKMKKEAAMSK
ncbi:MAG: AhpC/TSA family protein [Acidobacteriota bacterium]|nr:AhpC/TSA family protein [Acidobacteriota bacterium]